MADNNYTVAVDIHAVNGQTVGAFETGTYPCSAGLAFSPTSGISSVSVSAITLLGNTVNYSISTTAPLPLMVVNRAGVGSLPFNIVFANSTPDSLVMLAYPISANANCGIAALSAGFAGTVQAPTQSSNTTVAIVSGSAGWRGDGTRIWPTIKEFLRMRLLGYI